MSDREVSIFVLLGECSVILYIIPIHIIPSPNKVLILDTV